MNHQDSERRRFRRFPFHSEATLQLKGVSCVATLKDLSLHGALLELRGGATALDSIQLKPCLVHIHHNGNEDLVVFNGLVLHVKHELLGIKFIGVGEAERQALIQLIDLNLASPTLLDRDVASLLEFLSSLKETETTPEPAA